MAATCPSFNQFAMDATHLRQFTAEYLSQHKIPKTSMAVMIQMVHNWYHQGQWDTFQRINFHTHMSHLAAIHVLSWAIGGVFTICWTILCQSLHVWYIDQFAVEYDFGKSGMEQDQLKSSQAIYSLGVELILWDNGIWCQSTELYSLWHSVTFHGDRDMLPFNLCLRGTLCILTNIGSKYIWPILWAKHQGWNTGNKSSKCFPETPIECQPATGGSRIYIKSDICSSFTFTL